MCGPSAAAAASLRLGCCAGWELEGRAADWARFCWERWAAIMGDPGSLPMFHGAAWGAFWIVGRPACWACPSWLHAPAASFTSCVLCKASSRTFRGLCSHGLFSWEWHLRQAVACNSLFNAVGLLRSLRMACHSWLAWVQPTSQHAARPQPAADGMPATLLDLQVATIRRCHINVWQCSNSPYWVCQQVI